jgi:hypothetical protein
MEHAFPREIAPGIHWIGTCSENAVHGRLLHVHAGQYLILGSDLTLLIDTGMPNFWPEVRRQLDQVLGDRPLDLLMPTHPEVPHASALPYILRRYPDCRLIGDSRDYRLYYPAHFPRMIDKRAGDEIDLGERKLVFVDAIMKDLPNTLWAYDEITKVLFVCDGFSFMHAGSGLLSQDEDAAEPFHEPGECALLTSELPRQINVEQASFILQRALYWSQFVDADLLFGRIRTLLVQYPARLLAPSHGNVIDNIEAVFPTIKQAHAIANRVFR